MITLTDHNDLSNEQFCLLGENFVCSEALETIYHAMIMHDHVQQLGQDDARIMHDLWHDLVIDFWMIL